MEQFENNYSTQLNGSIDDDDTTIVVDTAPVTMTGEFRIKIEDEIIKVGAVSGTSFTGCTRGAEGTTAASHSDDATVTHVLTAGALVDFAGPSLEIPGLASSPDRLPDTPDADDDEFDVTDTSDPLTGWTTMGSVTSMNINSTVKSHLYLRKAADTNIHIFGIYKTKTAPFTVTAKLTANTARGAYSRAGIFIGETTPGNLETIDIVYDATPNIFDILDMASPTSYTNTVTSVGAFVYGRTQPFYFRIIVASSTDVTYQYSYDGYFYSSLSASRNPGFTVGSAGLFVMPLNGSNDIEALFDWIRFTA